MRLVIWSKARIYLASSWLMQSTLTVYQDVIPLKIGYDTVINTIPYQEAEYADADGTIRRPKVNTKL